MNVYAEIYMGNVGYSREEASIDIDEMIAQLEDAKRYGATHVVGLSGNHRGARYVSLGSVVVELDDEVDY